MSAMCASGVAGASMPVAASARRTPGIRADSIPQRTTWSASSVAAPAIVSTRTAPAGSPGVPGSSSPSPASATAAA
jgi:hypothetical protein